MEQSGYMYLVALHQRTLCRPMLRTSLKANDTFDIQVLDFRPFFAENVTSNGNGNQVFIEYSLKNINCFTVTVLINLFPSTLYQ